MKIAMTAIIKIQRKRLYTQKAKNLRNFFIYKKLDTFQKAGQFPLRLYIKIAIYLKLRYFNEFIDACIYIKKE